MSKFWSPFVKDLVPYVPGEQPKLVEPAAETESYA